MTSSAVEELIDEGWPISSERLKECFGEGLPLTDISKLRKLIIDADLRDYSVPMLADRINRQKSEFKGPLVVQLVRMRNVSYPKISEMLHSDGLLKAQFSDGHSNVFALLFEPVVKLNVETTPGTKFRLSGTIALEGNMLLINNGNCKFLGGQVERLIEKWKVERNFVSKSIRNTESSAPKWIPFSKRKLDGVDSRQGGSRSNSKAFRANDTIANSTGKGKDGATDNAEFEAARKANIENVLDGSTTKKFAPSQIKPKIATESSPRANVDAKKNAQPSSSRKDNRQNELRKGRRSGRNDENTELYAQRPTERLTISDFLQAKFVPNEQILSPAPCVQPSPSQICRDTSDHSNSKGTSNGGRSLISRSSNRNRKDFDDSQKIAEGRRFASSGPRRTEVMNSNRSGGQNHRRNGHMSNAGKESKNPNPLPTSKDFPPIEAVTEGFARVNVDGGIKGNSGYPQKQSGYFGSRPDYGRDSGIHGQVFTPTASRREFTPPLVNPELGIIGLQPSSHQVHRWKCGDKCLAPWSDGQYYLSTIKSLGPADMCTIEYDNYGNRSNMTVAFLVPPNF